MTDDLPLDERGILELIAADTRRLATLILVGERNLKDWWIGAGFVRSLVWDHLHGGMDTPPRDIDVMFYDPSDISEEREDALAEGLATQVDPPWPDIKWDVKNQARMHTYFGRDEPFGSSRDAMCWWPETATVVAVKMAGGRLIMAAPYGIDDLVNMVVRPTPPFRDRLDEYRKRVAHKNWQATWPKITVLDV